MHDTYGTHFDKVIAVAHPGKADTTDPCTGVRPRPADGERPTV
ncbi:hypothetical protein WBG99_24205 [Streptomyces sp. TG1A-60]